MTDPDRIHLSRLLPCRISTAWALWADPEKLAAWFGPHIVLNACSGGRFSESWTKDGRPAVTAGTVVLCVPPDELAWTWSDDDWPAQTMVSLHFKAVGDGTRLSLAHNGWEALPAPSRETIRLQHEAGWTMHLDNLERFCLTLQGA